MAALIDWCSFTFPDSSMEDIPGECFRLMSSWTKESLVLESSSTKNFYENNFQFFAYRDGEPISLGFIGFGGEHQRGRANLQINGTGCSLIRNWHPVMEFLDSVDETRLTRVDIALDFLKGEISIDDFFEWYEAGLFTKNGRPPSHCVHGCWINLEQRTGRTIEIGKRKNGLMFRGYEKGRQLGNPDSPWVRAEVEFHNVDRELLPEMLVNPEPFFGGSYPCLQPLIKVSSQRILTQRTEGETSLEKLLRCLRDSYGKALNVANESTHKNKTEELLLKLIKEGIPKRLKKSSLSMLPA